MTFYRRFLRVALALDDNPGVFRPSGRFFLWVGVQNVRIERLQMLVRLKFILDLSQECAGGRLVEAEYADGYLGVLQNLLDDAAEGDCC